jgi:hypothetical protein
MLVKKLVAVAVVVGDRGLLRTKLSSMRGRETDKDSAIVISKGCESLGVGNNMRRN